jgi:hypothetical protein
VTVWAGVPLVFTKCPRREVSAVRLLALDRHPCLHSGLDEQRIGMGREVRRQNVFESAPAPDLLSQVM